MRHVLSEWADWADPNTSRKPKKEGARNLAEHLIEFPYRINEETPMTKEVFDALSDEEAYKLCFKGVTSGEDMKDDLNFKIETMPYILNYKRASKYGNCKYCNKYNCSMCRMLYQEDKTVSDCLKDNDHTTNNSLFSEQTWTKGKEFGLSLTFHSSLDAQLFYYLSNS